MKMSVFKHMMNPKEFCPPAEHLATVKNFCLMCDRALDFRNKCFLKKKNGITYELGKSLEWENYQ